MAKRTTKKPAPRRLPDPVKTNQKAELRELARLNAGERRIQRGLRKLRAEIVKTDAARREIYEWLGQRFELEDVTAAAAAAGSK